MTRFIVDYRWSLNIAEVTCEKETPQMYTGVKFVRNIFGRIGYVPKRVSKDECYGNIIDAIQRGITIYKEAVEQTQIKLNDERSRLGELEALLKKEN